MRNMFPRYRPQFRKERVLPDRRTHARKSPQCTRCPGNGPMYILDPCAGEGVAIAEAAHALGREHAGRSPSSSTQSGAPCPRPGRSLPYADLMDTMISKQSFGLLWLNPPYGDLVWDVNGNIGYQGQGRPPRKAVLSAFAVAVAIRRRAGLHRPRLRARRGTGRLADAPLHRSADLPSGGNAVQAGGDLRRRVRQREQTPDGVKAVRNLLLQVGLGEVEAEELPSEWPFLPYIVPASPAEPGHFFRVTMGAGQFADEVGRLQSLWPSQDTQLGPRSSRCVHRRGPCPTGISPLALAAGAISGVVRSKTGRVLVVKGDTHKDKTLQREFTEREDGSIAETRILTDKFVPVIRAWDMTPWLPDSGRGVDHP